MAGARSLLQNLTPRGRVVLGVSALGALLLLFVMVRMATQPSYATLMSGLDPADTGEITKALDEQGIGYELQNNGTAIAVEKSQTAQARIALAESGAAGGDKPGFELFDEQKLGASDFEQKVSYQRALEGEVARTIGQVDGVSSAQVRLTLPEDELFSEEAKPATAAVLLSTRGTGLDGAAVRGIARLVASSVEGLKPSNVTITDESGQLLWPSGEGGAEGGATPATKRAAESRYERELEAGLAALIARTVGPDKGQVQVKATLNTDEATREDLKYAKKGVPLRESSEEETLEGGGGAAGAAGAEGNIPSFAQGGAGASNYERNSEETEYGVDKTVTRTKIAPGTVEGMSVALLLDESVPAADATALEEAVASAAGLDEERGDTLTVSQVAFAEQPDTEPPGGAPAFLGPAKYVGLGVAVLVFLMLVARHLRRREDDELAGEPVWLRELEAPTTLAELQRAEPETPRSNGSAEGNGHGQLKAREVEELVTREPERVAQQVRAWMNEG